MPRKRCIQGLCAQRLSVGGATLTVELRAGRRWYLSAWSVRSVRVALNICVASYLSLSLSLYIYIYIYMCIHMYVYIAMCVYIYIYIYIYTHVVISTLNHESAAVCKLAILLFQC